jgi:dienelactone hydrolase
MRHSAMIVVVALLAVSSIAAAAELHTAAIPSTRDQQPQKVRYFIPANVSAPVPLLVVFHTWSGDVDQTGFVEPCLAECERRGWALIHPDFRGPNNRPEASASDLAVQDVLDAIRWIEAQTKIDPQRRYAVGASGGGMMTLLMAGRHPELWAGASAWVPISDLAAWHGESVARKQRYAGDLEKACGGKPGDSAAIDAEYRQRSPLTYLAKAKTVPIDINAGIHDGYTGSVPIGHSLRAFNLLAGSQGMQDAQFTAAEIEQLTARREIPARDADKAPQEAERQHKVLLRRTAGTARLTIFDGGHEGDMPTAIRWLAEQRRELR